MIRKARFGDIDAVIELAIASVSNNPIPVKIDQEAMRETIQACLNPAHFAYVNEVDGEVVAAFGAVVQKSFWFRGLSCSVVMNYSKAPGREVWLWREFARWVKGRSGIKVATVEFEPESNPRLIEFVRKLGFSRQSVNLTYVRGMENG